MPSYCTRQARATLDTVSPVESETRWTWKLRLGTEFFYSTPGRGQTRDCRRQDGDRRSRSGKPPDSGPDSVSASHKPSAGDEVKREGTESGIRASKPWDSGPDRPQ